MLNLSKNRFSAFFWTQFLGAFNDNFFKVALTMLATYRIAGLAQGSIKQMAILAAALFILPFFLFSALAGQLADKYPKTAVIKWVKFSEIIVMTLAVVGFMIGDLAILFGVLFLMGAQSAFFGPVKYSIIPELLHEDQLITGNGLVSMGTFVSILVGTILGGPAIAIGTPNPISPEIFLANLLLSPTSTASTIAIIVTSTIVVLVALIGYLFSKKIPYVGAADPTIKINKNFIQQTFRSLKYIRQEKTIFWCIIAIAWFWLYGALILQMIPTYTKNFLGGDEATFTLALAMFSLGIGAGALFCERLTNGMVEPAIFPLGAIGLILTPPLVYLAYKTIFLILPCLFLIGLFAGMFIVPLYSILQDRCKKEIRARTIAASGILDALFMVFSSGLAMLFSGIGLNEPQIFTTLALLTLLFTLIVLIRIPEFAIRSFLKLFFLIKIYNHENLPLRGNILVHANYSSLFEALLAALPFRRWPIIFLPKKQKTGFIKKIVCRWANIRTLNSNKKTAEITELLKTGDAVLVPQEFPAISHNTPKATISINNKKSNIRKSYTISAEINS